MTSPEGGSGGRLLEAWSAPRAAETVVHIASVTSLASCAARSVLPPSGQARCVRRRKTGFESTPVADAEPGFDPDLMHRSGRPVVLGHRSALATDPPSPSATCHADVHRELPWCRHPVSSSRLTRSLRARPSLEPRKAPPPRFEACAPTGVVAAVSSLGVPKHPSEGTFPTSGRSVFRDPRHDGSSRSHRGGLVGPTKRTWLDPEGTFLEILLRRGTRSTRLRAVSVDRPRSCRHVCGACRRSPADPWTWQFASAAFGLPRGPHASAVARLDVRPTSGQLGAIGCIPPRSSDRPRGASTLDGCPSKTSTRPPADPWASGVSPP